MSSYCVKVFEYEMVNDEKGLTPVFNNVILYSIDKSTTIEEMEGNDGEPFMDEVNVAFDDHYIENYHYGVPMMIHDKVLLDIKYFNEITDAIHFYYTTLAENYADTARETDHWTSYLK